MLKLGFSALLGAIFSLGLVGAAQADRSEGSTTARKGVVRCGGSILLRRNDTEIHTINYNLRNFDAAQSITIDRLRVFDATGGVIFDSSLTGLPVSSNGVLGPTNNVLAPSQTGQFQSDDFLSPLPITHRPIQAEIEWSSARDALTLDVTTTHLVRGYDAVNNRSLDERARNSGGCRSIYLK